MMMMMMMLFPPNVVVLVLEKAGPLAAHATFLTCTHLWNFTGAARHLWRAWAQHPELYLQEVVDLEKCMHGVLDCYLSRVDVDCRGCPRPHLYSALITASDKGYLQAVHKLLAAIADVHADDEGDYALFCAVHNGHVDVIEALLAAGAHVDAIDVDTNFNRDDEDLLGVATRQGRADIVRCLLATSTYTLDEDYIRPSLHDALVVAADAGNTTIVEMLLDAGAYPHLCDIAMTVASVNGHWKTLAILLDDEDSGSFTLCKCTFLAVVRKGYWRTVDVLLENAEYSLADMQAALRMATEKGYWKTAQSLLYGCEYDMDVTEHLQLAESNGHVEVASILRKYQ
jgi:hypothetical protein